MGCERGFLWLQRTFWQVLLALFSNATEKLVLRLPLQVKHYQLPLRALHNETSYYAPHRVEPICFL